MFPLIARLWNNARVSENLNTLESKLWPLTATRNDSGCLTIGGLSVTELAREYGTPLFVIDEADVRTRATEYAKAFASNEIATIVFYASKAFLTTKIAKWVNSEGLFLDVCTDGELEVALRAGIQPNQILFHGNNKSVAELEKAVTAGVGRIVLDSFLEIERLNNIALTQGVTVQVLIRLTVGVEAHTHDFIATAHEDQKFGFSIASGAAIEAAESVIAADGLSLLGLHSHIGSQIFDANGFKVAAGRVIDLAAQIRDKFDFVVTELNLGGGMGIAYESGDDPLDVQEMAQTLQSIVLEHCHRTTFPIPTLAVEPGRAIIGPAGITIYEVGTVKDVDVSESESRRYISVDGGMSDNIRTALYEANYTAALASRISDAVPHQSRIVGKHCESGDIVVRDVKLQSDIAPGDLIAVAATGAYCRAMSSNYNYVVRPAVVGVRNGKSEVILRRETIDDVLAFDPGA